MIFRRPSGKNYIAEIASFSFWQTKNIPEVIEEISKIMDIKDYKIVEENDSSDDDDDDE